MQLQTDLTDSGEIRDYLSEKLKGLYSTEAISGPLRGGRKAALERLYAFDTSTYTRRNFVGMQTSELSADLRHGVLGILEVAKHFYMQKGQGKREFLKQLAWREFFGLVLEQEGAAVFKNLEPAKYATHWQKDLPDDVCQANTGLPCVDAWVKRLVGTGYLHNHERLWFAAYLVHWRRTDWLAGFYFFREHLLDGDIASNALSWQWVASTFSHKPYFMNQDNIAKYSGNEHCASCRVACPFRKSYAELERELFGGSYGWAL